MREAARRWRVINLSRKVAIGHGVLHGRIDQWLETVGAPVAGVLVTRLEVDIRFSKGGTLSGPLS